MVRLLDFQDNRYQMDDRTESIDSMSQVVVMLEWGMQHIPVSSWNPSRGTENG
jgi:hypothetical protein